jgi:hypothetical protein
MIDSKCPDCGVRGKRIDWRPFPTRLVEHVFVCTNLTCIRARLPWSIFERRIEKVAS